MSELLSDIEESASFSIGHKAGLTTFVMGETTSIIAALATHKYEAFSAGTTITIGATVLAAIGASKLFGKSESSKELPIVSATEFQDDDAFMD